MSVPLLCIVNRVNLYRVHEGQKSLFRTGLRALIHLRSEGSGNVCGAGHKLSAPIIQARDTWLFIVPLQGRRTLFLIPYASGIG